MHLTRRSLLQSAAAATMSLGVPTPGDAGTTGNPPLFWGDPNLRVSAIDVSGGIKASRLSGQTPAFFQFSAINILCSGNVVDNNGNPILIGGVPPPLRPFERLEFRWDFGDRNGTELFVDPYSGAQANADTDQIGPVAAYCYRSAGIKVVTLTVRGIRPDGAYLTRTATLNLSVSKFVPTTRWFFDSVHGDDTNNDGKTDVRPWRTLVNLPRLGSTNVELNFARGSSWSNDRAAVIQYTGSDGLRLQAYTNPSAPRTAKPQFHTTDPSKGNAISLFVGTGHSDVVLSGLDMYTDVGANANGDAFSLSATNGAADIWLDNCNCTLNVSGGNGTAAQMYAKPTVSVGTARSWFTRCGFWGGNYSVPGSGAFAIAYGSWSWMTYFGVKASLNSPVSTMNHVINPEICGGGPGLARWCTMTLLSGGNLGINIRAPAFNCNEPLGSKLGNNMGYISGTTLTLVSGSITGPDLNGSTDGLDSVVMFGTKLVGPGGGPRTYTVDTPQTVGSARSPVHIFSGDWVGGEWLTADCLISGAAQGHAYTNENNWSPYGAGNPAHVDPYRTGYFREGIVERCRFANTIQHPLLPVAILNMTIRDCLTYNFGNEWFSISSGTGTRPDTSGMNDFLSLSCYRNKVFRPSTTTTGPSNILDLFPTQDSMTHFQEITDNVFYDLLPSTGSTHFTIATNWTAARNTNSLIDRNKHYVPTPVGRAGGFIKNGLTSSTLPQFQGAGFDRNGLGGNGNPGWVDPANGNFNS
jgi:hypothetical protein